MKREMGAEPAGRAGSPSDVLGGENTLEIARGIAKFNPVRDGDFDDAWCDDAIMIARVYLELVENRGGGREGEVTQSNSVREDVIKRIDYWLKSMVGKTEEPDLHELLTLTRALLSPTDSGSVARSLAGRRCSAGARPMRRRPPCPCCSLL